jgi:fatty acid desaturase/cytochrome b involved in lipid metabolism
MTSIVFVCCATAADDNDVLGLTCCCDPQSTLSRLHQLSLLQTMGKGTGAGGEQSASANGKKITLDELSKHRSPDNAWLSYRGKVYDVSGWQDHPGGSVIFTHAGDDCTDVFGAFHPASALKDLQKFEIGELDESVIPTGLYANKRAPEKQKEFERAYRELRAKLIAMGMFNSSPLFYVYKVTSNLAIVATSVFLAVSFDSILIHFVAALLLGLFWQQCGWLAHDFLHHQVFKTRTYGDLAGVVIGDLFQGFSVQWWKSKHNSHHAVPNLHESSPDAADGDPDIDTMPILAWSLKMAEVAEKSSVGRFMIKWQSVLYFPVLLFARLAWAYQSWVFVWGGYGQHSVKGASMDKKLMAYPGLEKLALVLHYVWLFAIMYHMPILNALMYFVVAQTSCGLMLAIVFGLGHNGMAVYPANERPDFWKLQVSTTRNVTSTPFVDWFCGGLQYQVDHHLFPMLPRHNLKKVHVLVESFCKDQGVTYHETDMLVGTMEVLTHLHKVSEEFVREFPAM